MKFTLSWLKTYLETSATADDLAAALTDLGMEVEGLEDAGRALAAFTICRVIEAGPHPNADRLRLCRVEAWLNGPSAPSSEVQVVCGAPNARTGLIGVFAPPGTHVPGTGVDLKPGVIRGVESNGMLCSERELMLSDSHDGIIELPADAPLGARFIDYRGLSDPVFDIKVTPNRPDALGVAGLARDLAARGLGRLTIPPTEPVPGGFESPVRVRLDASVAGKACPNFRGRYIRGVRNGPSPEWLQARLKAVGQRPISALVDITNFLTLDRNRPLHVFDADRLTGDICVRSAGPGETLHALDDRTYSFAGGETLVCDAGGPVGIGGIIGGLPTSCTDDTVNVFLECAYFDPVRTAETGRAHHINSDARYRFERGIDPAFTAEGIELATRMILDLCGGAASHVVEAGAAPDMSRHYTLRTGRVKSLAGMDVPVEEQRRILVALGFGVESDPRGLVCRPPSWRPDIKGEADLVEEVARVTSLSGLGGEALPRLSPGVAGPVLTPSQRREALLRRHMAAEGFSECITYSFIEERLAGLFGGAGDAVRLANPIASDMSHLRPSLIPGLVSAAARNQARGASDLALFELGPVFSGGEPENVAMELAGLRCGSNLPRNAWGARRSTDMADVLGDAETALARLGLDPAKLSRSRRAPDWFHPGRSGVLTLGPKNVVAVFGELHPRVLQAAGLKGAAMAFTLMPGQVPLPRQKSLARPALDAPEFQAVERDFAFVLDDRAEVGSVLKAAMQCGDPLVVSVLVFDVFEGAKAHAQLGPGKMSVAVSVRLQPRDGTLTEAAIEAAGRSVVSAVNKATGAVLRT